MSATLLPPAPAPTAPVPADRGRARLLAGKVLLAVAIVLIAAACTGRPKVPGSYGKPDSSVERNFIKGCTGKAKLGSADLNTAVCTCAYVNLKATVSFADFKKINSKLSKDPAALPEGFQSIIAGCVTSDGKTTSTTTPTGK